MAYICNRKVRLKVIDANIGLALNVFVNLNQKKYYWKNTGFLNLGWLKFDNKDSDEDETGFKVTSDLKPARYFPPILNQRS